MLLLTFTRRAAEAMTRRAEQICEQVRNGAAIPYGGALWSGTFHATGARLLRLYAEQIGLDPAFTVLDRSDAADLIDLVRDEQGLSQQDRRFPRKATCLAIYSYAVNAQQRLDAVLRKAFPWCSDWEAELKALFAGYVEAKQRQSVLDYDDLLLYWEQLMALPALAADIAARFDYVLVDEYQDTNALQAAIILKMKPDGRGVTVVGDDAQAIFGFRAASVRNILDFPRKLRAAGGDRDARAELPLDPADPRRRQRGDRPGTGAFHEKPVLGAALAPEARPGRGARRRRPGRLRGRAHPRLPRGRCGAAPAGGAVSHQPSQRPARGRAGAAQHPVRQVWRPEVPRGGPCQGRPGDPALGREPARSDRRLSQPAAAARDRTGDGAQGPAAAGGGQAGLRSARGLRGAGRGGRAVAGPRAPDARPRGQPACGRARSVACARSTIRCSPPSTSSPGRARRISISSSRSRPAIRAASASFAISPSIRRRRRATRPARRTATRTI